MFMSNQARMQNRKYRRKIAAIERKYRKRTQQEIYEDVLRYQYAQARQAFEARKASLPEGARKADMEGG
jgi:hypothetical protein